MGEQIQNLLLIAVGSAFVNNVVLSQFLGICPFLGVSKNVKTAVRNGKCRGIRNHDRIFRHRSDL